MLPECTPHRLPAITRQPSIAGVACVLLSCSCVLDEQRTRLPEFPAAFKTEATIRLGGLKAVNVLALVRNSHSRYFALDDSQRAVDEYDTNGKFVRGIGGSGNFPGRFATQISIAGGHEDNLYVLDVEQSRVHIFNPSGALIRSFAFAGTGISGTSLAIDRTGRVFIAGFDGGTNCTPCGHVTSQKGEHLLPRRHAYGSFVRRDGRRWVHKQCRC